MLVAFSVVIAGLILFGAFRLGQRSSFRGHEMPWWLVLVLVLIAAPIGLEMIAIAAAWAMGKAWGGRADAVAARKHRVNITTMRRAIRNRELEFHYQPIVAIETGTYVSVETLVRWNRPGEGLLTPFKGSLPNWLDLLLGDELSGDFYRLAWAEILPQVSLWPHLRVAVNTNPNRLTQEGWADSILKSLADAEVDGRNITIEITEEAVLKNLPVVKENLRRVREAGVKIALDDFGASQANIGTLVEFAGLIDVVKIDRIITQAENRRYAEMIVYLAHMTGLGVVAEGVETEDQREWLERLGVQTGQGWLWAAAMPAGEFHRKMMMMMMMQGGVA